MGIPVLILGESGSGKSTSLRNFEPGEIGIFNVASKPLPFRKKLPSVNGSDYNKIIKSLSAAKLKSYAIDDSQYLLAFEFFDRAKETGYLTTTKPFEWLYTYKDNLFEQKQLLGLMSEQARGVGVRNLATLFKAYTQMVGGNTAPGYNKTDFTGQELELDCGSWEASDTGIYGVDRMGLDVVACYHPIMPVQRLINIDSGIHKVKLAFSLGRRWNYVIEDRSTVSDSRSIIGLSKYGVMVNSETSKPLVRYLADVEQLNYDQIPEVASVGRLGWIEDYGFSPFVEHLVFDGEEEFRNRFESIKEHGSYDKWLDTCRKVRAGKTPGNVIARIVLAASFASVLVKPCNCLPFFVHLWGGSETGKTVGLLLAASVWANPELGTYIQTFNATDVGKELGAAFCNSMPLIIDELQMVKDNRKDFDKMIYQLSEGVGRSRGKKSGGLQKTTTWRNCVITTGEFPIISPNSGAGAVNRTIEVDCHDIHLFDDPKAVAVSLYENYGFAGRGFVDKLMEPGQLERVRAMQDSFQTSIKTADTMDKQTASAALIMTADALIDEWIFKDGVRLTPGDITKFLVSKETVNQNGRALQYERAAMRGDPMPDGLSAPDQWMYRCLVLLYDSAKRGIIDRETGRADKGRLAYQRDLLERKFRIGEDLVTHSAQMFKAVESAANAYVKERTLENADRLYEAIYSVPVMKKEA